MPRHANHKTAVVSPVGRPPFRAVGHQDVEVLLHGIRVPPERVSIIEIRAQEVALAVVLVKFARADTAAANLRTEQARYRRREKYVSLNFNAAREKACNRSPLSAARMPPCQRTR